MACREDVKNIIGTELYSMQTYGLSYFSNFNPATDFEKWATVEVANFDAVPRGMETYVLPGACQQRRQNFSVYIWNMAACF
jgi:AraC family transcriptional regulator